MTNERGPIEIRSAVIEAVDYPDRTISLLVAPYDEWAEVEYKGRIVEESLAPGAFGAVRNRARKFLVNMEHDPARWVGTVLDLVPDDPTGLQAKVKIRRCAEGDQALNDAADELLGASIGMAVAPGDELVDGHRRRIRKAFLDHIALTATPAYLGAKVLEVRSAAPVVTPPVISSTPNLDAIRAEMREREYRSLPT
jgi:HK97 family phage prohead protease